MLTFSLGWAMSMEPLEYLFIVMHNNHHIYYVAHLVATPLWPSVGVNPNIPKVEDLESSGTPECLGSTARLKTPRIDMFLVSLETS